MTVVVRRTARASLPRWLRREFLDRGAHRVCLVPAGDALAATFATD